MGTTDVFSYIEVDTRAKVDIIDITHEVQRVVAEQGLASGICFVFCPHTTAAIVLNEAWDPDVELDVAAMLNQLVPQDFPYRHAEGNSPSHIKSVLVGSDHFVFVQDGELTLGQWQGIFLAEFDGPRRRRVWIKVVSDVPSG